MTQVLKTFFNLSLKKYPKNVGYIRIMSSLPTDLIKQSIGPAANDFLLDDLKNARTTDAVFKLVSSQTKMNSRHLIQALRTIFILQKHDNVNISSSQVLKHPEFEKLCRQVKSKAGEMDIRDTIDALKVITYLGVSSQSAIYQVLLQLIRHNVNNLSLPNIMFLEFLFKQVKSCPLIEALKIALPIVFEVHLPIKMDRTNISHLAEYFYYISTKNVSHETIKLLVNVMLKCEEDLDAKSAISTVWSICDLPSDYIFERLLRKALGVIMINIDNIPFHDLETTMTKLISKYNPRTPFYYNDVFLDLCANYLVENDYGFEQAIHILRKFLRISHMHNNLLDYVSEKCYQNPNLIVDGHHLHIYSIICTAAMTDYRPKYWKELKDAIIKTNSFANIRHSEMVWIKLATSLCVLGIYKEEVFEKALDISYLQNLFKRCFKVDNENTLLVYQAIKAFKPDFVQFLPSSTFMEDIISNNRHNNDFPLEASLFNVMGGENYVKTKIPSKLWFQIDHVIVLRKGGYPVSFSISDNAYLEDIEVPTESQIVLILVLNSIHYTLNDRRMKGTTSLMIKILEANGYIVVPICLDLWKSLPDFEKIPHIMQSIKLKTECVENVSQSVI